MTEERGECRRSHQFWAEFLMATGRDQDQAGLLPNALAERVVGGGIAGVKGDEQIDGTRIGLGDGAHLELEALELEALGELVGVLDQVGACLDPGDVGFGQTELAGKEVPDREGEVAASATHVDDTQGPLWGKGQEGGRAVPVLAVGSPTTLFLRRDAAATLVVQEERGIAQEVADDFRVAKDLTMFVGPFGEGRARGIDEAKGLKPIDGGLRERALAWPIV